MSGLLQKVEKMRAEIQKKKIKEINENISTAKAYLESIKPQGDEPQNSAKPVNNNSSINERNAYENAIAKYHDEYIKWQSSGFDKVKNGIKKEKKEELPISKCITEAANPKDAEKKIQEFIKKQETLLIKVQNRSGTPPTPEAEKSPPKITPKR